MQPNPSHKDLRWIGFLELPLVLELVCACWWEVEIRDLLECVFTCNNWIRYYELTSWLGCATFFVIFLNLNQVISYNSYFTAPSDFLQLSYKTFKIHTQKAWEPFCKFGIRPSPGVLVHRNTVTADKIYTNLHPSDLSCVYGKQPQLQLTAC